MQVSLDAKPQCSIEHLPFFNGSTRTSTNAKFESTDGFLEVISRNWLGSSAALRCVPAEIGQAIIHQRVIQLSSIQLGQPTDRQQC